MVLKALLNTIGTLILLTLAGLIYWISVLSVAANVTSLDLVALLGLVAASLVMTFIGHGAASLVTIVRIPHICALALGEICCMSYLMIRSCLSGIAFYLFKIQISITSIEVLSVLVLIGAVVVKRQGGVSASRASLKDWTRFGALLICALGPIVFRELPRDLALSSDPDQHAFWASAVYQIGIVPWDQGLIGVGPFGYPAGFAAMNAIWMAFSGLSAVEIVTLQPQLQFILAILLCASCAPNFFKCVSCQDPKQHDRSKKDPIFFVSLACILIYWLILPYGLQSERIHGEGTPRLSCSLLAMSVLLIWIAQMKFAANQRANLALFCVAMSAASLIGTINPLSASFSIGITALIFTRLITRLINQRELTAKVTLYISASFLLPGAILLGEPYIVEIVSRFLGFSFFEASVNSHQIANTGAQIAFAYNSPFTWILPDELYSYLFAGTERLTGLFELTPLIIFITLVIWLVKGPAIAARWLAALILCGLTSWIAFNIHGGGDAMSPLYLVKPYLYETALQNGALLGVVLLSSGLSIAAYSPYRRFFYLAGLIGVVALVFKPEMAPATRLKAFNLAPRECHDNAGGCLSNAEISALKFISDHTSEIKRRYPDLTYSSAPKILILGHPVVRGPEKWVFPSGISKVVPLHSKLPVAFFYGRGNPAWSHENYLARVCKKLDLTWLRDRNVRFLVIGKRDPGCLSHRRDVVKNSETLFEMDGVRVLRMF